MWFLYPACGLKIKKLKTSIKKAEKYLKSNNQSWKHTTTIISTLNPIADLLFFINFLNLLKYILQLVYKIKNNKKTITNSKKNKK